ncbi:uncharacterized protein LOC132034655 [Lycium ferocissimum]|uniref:uncharacterized protein LOC132034655 n=1 Tax=Lycium ferocissimum TaxID=112874 RepID=UPI0028153E8F|nr:uncharacterized protein LOC132034655 [Lycium ferocissimum]
MDEAGFITLWGIYHYRMPFGLRNAGTTYMRVMTAIFHEILHRDIEVYVDDVITKPRIGFIGSRRGIELDPTKIKAIQEFPPPTTKKEVMSFLGRLNYIGSFIAQCTIIAKPILKLLKKDAPTRWTEDCQKAFDTIKRYLSNPPVVRGEWATKNEKIIPYVRLVKRLADRFQEVKFKHIPRSQNDFADALAIIASMIQHPDSKYIDLIRVKIRDQPTHCAFVEAEIDGKPWYADIKMYLVKGEYPEGITINQKNTIRKLANGFFLNKNILYKRTPDLGLLRCVDSIEATRLIEELHAETCGLI